MKTGERRSDVQQEARRCGRGMAMCWDRQVSATSCCGSTAISPSHVLAPPLLAPVCRGARPALFQPQVPTSPRVLLAQVGSNGRNQHRSQGQA